jgi:hypothetical protein
MHLGRGRAASGARPPRRAGLSLGVVTLCLGALASGGCSRKLSRGGNAMEVITYDILGMERGTSEYYQIVLDAHDRKTFCYRCTDDTYLADKSLDAIYRLGNARYARLEGEAQVILLLSDVLIEDKIASARNMAAGSLTRLALRLPEVPGPSVPDRGDRFLGLVKELDALHDENGRRRSDTPATRQRVRAVVEEIGSLDFARLQDTKNALKYFPGRAFVTQETDPALREVFDRTMARRSRAVVLASLQGKIDDPVPHVRQAVVQGLKTLGAARALPDVVQRLEAENHALVKGEMAEYLGAVGGGRAAEALVPLLHDDDGGVRHRAQAALVRLARVDLGRDEAAWDAWRKRTYGAPPPAVPARGAPSVPAAPPPAPAPPEGPGGTR